MATQRKRLAIMLVGVACLLLLPLIAMQFTPEVKWTPFDFLVAGGLLLGACLAFEFFALRRSSLAYRLAVGLTIAAVLAIVWLELAVGIFGSPWAGS
jgi:hypothetical protein